MQTPEEDAGWKLLPHPRSPSHQPVWHFQMQEVLRVGCQAAGFEERPGSMHHRLGVFHQCSQGLPICGSQQMTRHL